MCLEISNNLLLMLQDAPKRIFSMNSQSSGQLKNYAKTLPTLHPLSMVIFATASVLAFVLLHDSRFNFHCYTQCEATPTQKSARKCAATSYAKDCKTIHSSRPAQLNCPIDSHCPAFIKVLKGISHRDQDVFNSGMGCGLWVVCLNSKQHCFTWTAEVQLVSLV